MRVCAIDPGFDRLGIAILDGPSGSERLCTSACIRTSSKDAFVDRLTTIGQETAAFLDAYTPDVVAVETLFFTSNQKTAMRVAEARGVVMYEARTRGIEIHEYTPLQIKIAITGYGKAPKQQVAHMTRHMVHIEKNVSTDDEMDAIATGVTCIASTKPHP